MTTSRILLFVFISLIWAFQFSTPCLSLMLKFLEENSIFPERVTFLLYTRLNSDVSKFFTSNSTSQWLANGFLPNTPTKVIVHGFSRSPSYEPIADIKNAYLETNVPMNIIMIDWSDMAAGSNLEYPIVVHNTKIVAEEVAEVLEKLLHAKVISLSDIHLIGHSLGAHVCGMVGSTLQANFGKVQRITGLDPAKPLFVFASRSRKLDPSDANFVDVIHTSNIKGYIGTLGTVDFYPNLGILQPGCGIFDTTCNHAKVLEYYAKSITNPKKYKACRCNAIQIVIPIIIPSSCTCDSRDPTSIAYMGNDVSTRVSGIYYLSTKN